MNAPDFIQQLEAVIRDRMDADPGTSYTASLVQSGQRRVAQKVGEEGVEVALAATSGTRDELLDEAADLVYHLLVLLALNDAAFADVSAVLEKRHVSP
jgi:phosphoribosyl-ATP pyrophosphohydrolase